MELKLSVADITGIGQVAIAIFGLSMVVLQLRHASRLSKVQLIAHMNDRLASFYDVVPTIRRLEDVASWNALGEETQERILDYISVFETIESMRRLGTLSMKEIDYYFAGRFSSLVDRRGVQAAIIYNVEFRDELYPLFSLHRSLLGYRGKSTRPEPLDEFDPKSYARLADHR